MSYTRAEIDAEIARRNKPSGSDSEYSLAEIDAEIARRRQPSNKESTGWSGVGEDILSGIGAVPGAIGQMAKELPGEALGAGKQLWNDKLRVLQNILIGAGQAGQAINQAPSNIRNYLEKKQLINPDTASWLKDFKAPDIDFAEALGRKGNKSGDALISSSAELLPFIMGGGLPGSAAKKLAGQSAGLALNAAGKNENPITAALLPPTIKGGVKAIAGIPKVASKVAGNLTPSGIIAKHFGGNLPIEEVIKNSEAAGNTKTGLGRVLQSPSLNTAFENITAETPFGGGKNILSEQAATIAEKSKRLVENVSENPNEMIHKLVLDARKNQNKIKNKSFEPVNKLAKEEKFRLSLPKTREIIKDKLDSIREGALYKNDEKFKSAISKLSSLYGEADNTIKIGGKSYPASIFGEKASSLFPPKKTPSIVEARTVGENLYDTGKRMLKNPNSADQELGTTYLKIAKSIKKETKSEIKSKGSPGLKEADDLAMKNYKDNYAPFLDKEIHKILNGDELSENFIRDVIRPGKATDRASRIKKVQSLLPEKDRGLLGNAFLSKGTDINGRLDFRELLKTFNSLGSRQQKALFNKESLHNIKELDTLARLNPDAVTHMFNPKTGARAQQGLQIIPALIGGYGGPGIAAAIIGSQILGARTFNKLMTSPKFREKVINKKIKLSEKKESSGKKQIPNFQITYKKEEEK